MGNNLVSAKLSSKDTAEIIQAIQTIKSKLPFLRTLTPQERRERTKMGPRTVGFDDKCIAYMQSNPEFLPRFVDPDEVEKDRDLRTQMMRFVAELDSLTQQVDDTLMIVRGEVLVADLAYYQNARNAARRGLPAAKGIVEDLQKSFQRNGRGPAAANDAAPATQAA
jgi:hypothetical protein